MEAFSDLKTPSFVIDEAAVRDNIHTICLTDKSQMQSDSYVRSYYLNGGGNLWTYRFGIDEHTDTLLKNLSESVGELSFSSSVFYIKDIADDVTRIRDLDFDSETNTIDRVVARLEYHLTKALFRYITGQRFGFVRPQYLLNRIDTVDSSSSKPEYRRLFDVDIERPDTVFYASAMQYVREGRIGELFRYAQPQDTLYYRLASELRTASTDDYRKKLICNMERCRWREKGRIKPSGKFVVVNIPALSLYAFNGGSNVLTMKIGCGAIRTKTPLLTSAIERMDVNPVWNIPKSIVEKEVAIHAGDAGYFERNNYHIINRATSEQMEPEDVTSEMFKSGKYRVFQEGGEGNSMGRIVFRFANNFSVYLHDTSSKSVFNRSNRCVSHGCVRVQMPYELAEFLLDNPDEWLLDRLRISMDMCPKTSRGLKYISKEGNNRKLVNTLSVKPSVPLFIIYNTVCPDENGRLCTYPDVYGYDDIIYQEIKLFLN